MFHLLFYDFFHVLLQSLLQFGYGGLFVSCYSTGVFIGSTCFIFLTLFYVMLQSLFGHYLLQRLCEDVFIAFLIATDVSMLCALLLRFLSLDAATYLLSVCLFVSW